MLRIEKFNLNIKKELLLSIDELMLESGRKINIIANNNNGKSIFLKTIHGDFKKYDGNISITEKSPAIFKKRKKSILLETVPHLLPEETVWNNLILPFRNLTLRQKQKITDLCRTAELNEKIDHKVRYVSYSEQKFLELIRAVVQLPYLLLLDDFDIYFDRMNAQKAGIICDYAVNNGTTIIAATKKKIDDFDLYYRIHLKKLLQV
ncbi:MAG: ATP-binding cassette domain-containing protein [Candidatus Cloacimonetes bacterium]|nr:ATP-binding cassette domain-containing protein [Candidatus Cloacimonadota bacterium]